MLEAFQPSHRTAFLQLAEQFYHTDAVSHPVPAAHYAAAFDAVLQGSPYAEGYMLRHQTHLAGFGLVSKTYSMEAGGGVLWLEDLFVLPAYRGHGLGRELLLYLKSRVPQEFCRIRLEISPANLGARRLYEGVGFTELPYVQLVLGT